MEDFVMNYIDDAGNIVTVMDEDTECVRFYPEGGGPVYRMSREDFYTRFSMFKDRRVYRKCRVTLDDNEPILTAYTRGEKWNGWTTPMFTRDQADLLAASMPKYLTYDPERNIYVYGYHDSDEDMIFEMETIKVDGQYLDVYPIGSGSWCWFEVEEE